MPLGLIRGSEGARAGKRLFCWLCCTVDVPIGTTCASSSRPGQSAAHSMLLLFVKRTLSMSTGRNNCMAALLSGQACW